jgi:Flp pilus assembly protein CpaB
MTQTHDPPQQVARPERPIVATRHRSMLSRFTMAHGLMVLSGLLAFVLIAAVVGDRSERMEVAVARADIPAGAVVGPEMVEMAELPADSAVAGRIATLDQLGAGQWVATEAIVAGDPVRRSALAEDTAAEGLRSMSIPVPKVNAVGGELRVGDRVDVIDVVDGEAGFVVANAQVVGMSAPSTAGGITSGAAGDFFVVVEVDARQALAVAEALADGKVDVVRSTGAEPI